MSLDDLDIPDELPRWITDHIRLYLEDPEKAHYWDASVGGGTGMIPTLLLITTGRKSGRKRPLPLIYQEIDGNFVVIGSKAGAPEHPAWYRNLVATPECELRVGPRTLQARARTAQGAERERLWQALVDVYAPYEEYQQRAGERQIPVVVLEPA